MLLSFCARSRVLALSSWSRSGTLSRRAVDGRRRIPVPAVRPQPSGLIPNSATPAPLPPGRILPPRTECAPGHPARGDLRRVGRRVPVRPAVWRPQVSRSAASHLFEVIMPMFRGRSRQHQPRMATARRSVCPPWRPSWRLSPPQPGLVLVPRGSRQAQDGRRSRFLFWNLESPAIVFLQQPLSSESGQNVLEISLYWGIIFESYVAPGSRGIRRRRGKREGSSRLVHPILSVVSHAP